MTINNKSLMQFIITAIVTIALYGCSHNVETSNDSNQTNPTLAENLPTQAIPTLAKNGLYDHVTTDFVVKLIQDNWTKIHQQSDDSSNDLQFDRIYYVDPKEPENKLWVKCFASLNDTQEANNNAVDVFQRNGYQLADISYSGLDSRTYLLVEYSMTTTAFTATLRNCTIVMFARAYDGKAELDAEVKYLQQINK